jgi:hypothetical protein
MLRHFSSELKEARQRGQASLSARVTYYKKLTYTFLEMVEIRTTKWELVPRTITLRQGNAWHTDTVEQLLHSRGVEEVRDMVGFVIPENEEDTGKKPEMRMLEDPDSNEDEEGEEATMSYGDVMGICVLPDNIKLRHKVWLQVWLLHDRKDFGTYPANRQIEATQRGARESGPGINFKVSELMEQELVSVEDNHHWVPLSSVIELFTVAMLKNDAPAPQACTPGSNVLFHRLGRKISTKTWNAIDDY